MSYEEFAVFDLQNKSQMRSAKSAVGPSKPFTRPHLDFICNVFILNQNFIAVYSLYRNIEAVV